MTTIQSLKGKIAFAIITIRSDEFEAVLQRFPPEETVSGELEYNISRVTAQNGSHYTCAIVRCLHQGNQWAQAAANALIQDLDPQWILVVGIAGAVPSNDFTLGDVLLSTRIEDLTVAAENPGGSVDYDIRGGYVHPAVERILANLRAAQVAGWNAPESIGTQRPEVDLTALTFDEGVDQEWQEKVEQALRYHFGSVAGRNRPPTFHDGPIASSDRLIRNVDVIRVWRRVARRIIGVEMESAGAYNAARRRDHEYPVLAIRGISDIIGFRRGGDWTGYACHTAAAFTFALVKSGLVKLQVSVQVHVEAQKSSSPDRAAELSADSDTPSATVVTASSYSQAELRERRVLEKTADPQ